MLLRDEVMTVQKNFNIFNAFIVIIISYFLQIYPYIHFHHSHGHDHFQIEVSFHPIEVDSDHLPEHHGHDDQHNNDSDHSKWYVARTYYQRIVHQFESAALPLTKDIYANLTISKPFHIERGAIDLDDCFIRKKESRGPPDLF